VFNYHFLFFSMALRRCPICGPKLSLCCSIISIWGIIQLLLMGIFFYIDAIPLLDDIPLDGKDKNGTSLEYKVLYDAIFSRYSQNAYNCWIAAFLYVGMLVFSGSQFFCNTREKLSSSSSSSLNNNNSYSIQSPFIRSSAAATGTNDNGQNAINFTDAD